MDKKKTAKDSRSHDFPLLNSGQQNNFTNLQSSSPENDIPKTPEVDFNSHLLETSGSCSAVPPASRAPFAGICSCAEASALGPLLEFTLQLVHLKRASSYLQKELLKEYVILRQQLMHLTSVCALPPRHWISSKGHVLPEPPNPENLSSGSSEPPLASSENENETLKNWAGHHRHNQGCQKRKTLELTTQSLDPSR
ncbi:hypothetical protein A6R68_14457, partial [Neotoma lepida]